MLTPEQLGPEEVIEQARKFSYLGFIRPMGIYERFQVLYPSEYRRVHGYELRADLAEDILQLQGRERFMRLITFSKDTIKDIILQYIGEFSAKNRDGKLIISYDIDFTDPDSCRDPLQQGGNFCPLREVCESVYRQKTSFEVIPQLVKQWHLESFPTDMASYKVVCERGIQEGVVCGVASVKQIQG